MIYSDVTSTSVGTWVAVGLGVLALILLVIGVLLIVVGIKGYDFFDAGFPGVVATVVAAGLFIGIGFGMYPYDREYHSWREVTGTVEKVDSRWVGAAKSTTERVVVQFEGGEQRACDDTRCKLLEPGQTLTLTCKREWQFAGTDGWACNFVGVRE